MRTIRPWPAGRRLVPQLGLGKFPGAREKSLFVIFRARFTRFSDLKCAVWSALTTVLWPFPDAFLEKNNKQGSLGWNTSEENQNDNKSLPYTKHIMTTAIHEKHAPGERQWPPQWINTSLKQFMRSATRTRTRKSVLSHPSGISNSLSGAV